MTKAEINEKWSVLYGEFQKELNRSVHDGQDMFGRWMKLRGFLRDMLELGQEVPSDMHRTATEEEIVGARGSYPRYVA